MKSNKKCPLDENHTISGCAVTSCMYFSVKLSGCGYVELHGSTDIDNICEHKCIDRKTFVKTMKDTAEDVKRILILEKYTTYVVLNHTPSKRFSKEVFGSAQSIIVKSILGRLPRKFPAELIPSLIDEDVLSEFFESNSLESIPLQELLFDVPVETLKENFQL